MRSHRQFAGSGHDSLHFEPPHRVRAVDVGALSGAFGDDIVRAAVGAVTPVVADDATRAVVGTTMEAPVLAGRPSPADLASAIRRRAQAVTEHPILGTLEPADAAFAQRMDVAHVFLGTTDSPRPGGLHHVSAIGIVDDVIVSHGARPYRPGATWTASIDFPPNRYLPRGVVKGGTTMFPKEWSRVEVLRAIRQAEARLDGAGGFTREGAGSEVGVANVAGIDIVVVRRPGSRHVTTAYPRHDGQPFAGLP